MPTPSRYFRGQACCDGCAPVWDTVFEGGIGKLGGPLSDDEWVAISAVQNYGGTFKAGHPPQLMPMEHTNLVNWNRPIFMAAGDSWVAPFDRSLPRLRTFADLPSLPDPDVGPQNGLPHHQATLDYQARERAKRVPFDNFRIVYNEATGQHRVEILWCLRCGPDMWEQFCDDLSSTFTEMVPVIRGVAMICSYIPVLGTAISFVINATTSLLEGRDLDTAFLDGIGGALPGQPASGMAFTATRSIINGDRVDRVAIQTALAALPVGPELRSAIATAIEIARAVARGENITNIALEQLRQQLPESGRKAMDVARRLCRGENVEGIVSEELRAAARNAAAQGEAAVNSFIAQAGYEGAMESAPNEIKDGVRAGVTVGVMETRGKQFIGTFGSVPEKNPLLNETHLQKGQRLIAAGAKFHGRLVSDILKGHSLTLPVEHFDSLTGTWTVRTMTYKVDGPFTADVRPMTDAWRRGFIIAIGVCEGSTQRGPGQTAVYQTMAEAGGRDGFDAGQAVARWRSKFDLGYHVFSPTETKASNAGILGADAAMETAGRDAVAARINAASTSGVFQSAPAERLAVPIAPADAAQFAALAIKGRAIALADPVLAALHTREPEGAIRTGFEIGIGIADNQTAWGPGKQALIDKLPAAQKVAADRAAHFRVEQNARGGAR